MLDIKICEIKMHSFIFFKFIIENWMRTYEINGNCYETNC